MEEWDIRRLRVLLGADPEQSQLSNAALAVSFSTAFNRWQVPIQFCWQEVG
jgi:hypothetical protein